MRGTGFDADDGAALLRAFQGLQVESAAQGDAHKKVAQELESSVADPFDNWAAGHAERIRETQHVLLDVYIGTYEEKGGDVRLICLSLLHTHSSTNSDCQVEASLPHEVAPCK